MSARPAAAVLKHLITLEDSLFDSSRCKAFIAEAMQGGLRPRRRAKKERCNAKSGTGDVLEKRGSNRSWSLKGKAFRIQLRCGR